MDNSLTRLRRFITDHYDLEELRTLCVDLRVDYDSLRGEGKDAKARELVLLLGRRERLDALLVALRQGRLKAFDEAGLGEVAVETLYEALTDWEESTGLPGQRTVDARGAQIGVVGDHAHVEGGIHFHTEGGAHVKGDVETGGGDFVGRDKHVHGDEVHGDKIVYVDKRVQAEDLCDKELTYLDVLLKQYAYWERHYTPLAGIAEVRAAVEDGPRLDLPMPFIPPGFEKLVEHGYGERREIERVPVDDIRQAVTEHRRIILLGDPGSGKTTTLWRLAYEYAQAAREDEDALLPVFVPLGGYTDPGPFDAYLAHHLGPLGEHLEAYGAAGRLALLLDGLNEMPIEGYAGRVGRIRDFLDRHPEGKAVVTCRALDYVEKLERLQKVEISPLDEERIRAFLGNYLGGTAGEQCFWTMAGDEVRELWETWQRAGGGWAAFWAAEKMPRNVYQRTTRDQYRLWERLRQDPPPLLALSRNPYLLLMTAQVYASAGGELPANRARLFAAFVETLLEREQKRHPDDWIAAECIQRGLAALAYAMQAERGRGTTVERDWALERSRPVLPDCDAERLLYLATSATLLDAGEVSIRFYHQLLQEYFAAREMGQRAAAGEKLSRYWPASRWWEPSGWEETVILLAGMKKDASTLLEGLAVVNPVVAGRCLLEGGAQVSDEARRAVVETLISSLTDNKPPVARAQAGQTLARLGDPRPGVGLRPDGLPDIVWCEVPAGPFLMGSGDADEMAYDEEKPQHEVTLPAFGISKYPVTNAQYAAFVRDGGYTAKRRACWTQAGWEWKKDRTGPAAYGGVFDLPNHPVVMVTWYEAVAFCRWLTGRIGEWARLRRAQSSRQRVSGSVSQRVGEGSLSGAEGVVGGGLMDGRLIVRLPTEAEWEKAARGPSSTPLSLRDASLTSSGCGRRYPWGDDPDPKRANYDDTGIGSTSAVGIFPAGVSPCGALDMSGNVWEWCATRWQGKYPLPQVDEWSDDYLGGTARRVLRGGAFRYFQDYVRCAYRDWDRPNYRDVSLGLRIVVAPG